MNYQVYSKNVLVTDILREYLDMRMAHLDKISTDVISCRVDLSRDEHHRKGEVFRAEINLNVPGRLMRVVEQSADMRAAIDLATEKLLNQLRKQKDRRIGARRQLTKFMGKFRFPR